MADRPGLSGGTGGARELPARTAPARELPARTAPARELPARGAPARENPSGRSLPQAARLPAVSGLGLDSERARHHLVDQLVATYRLDDALARAMREFPRHRFVDPGLASRAYEDVALPIGHQQTISRPSTVARMLDRILRYLSHDKRSRSRVLEIGTGCGYQAGLLSRLFAEVYSLERVKDLHLAAKRNLRGLKCFNLRMVFGDGQQGLVAAAPFDVIIASACGRIIPEPWLEQLAVGGILLTPVSNGTSQVLRQIVRRAADQFDSAVVEEACFVPLLQGTQ